MDEEHLKRHDLSDEEWQRLEPLLPSTVPQRGGRWADHRTLINGVFFRTRSGAGWRDLPRVYGNTGVWQLEDGLQPASPLVTGWHLGGILDRLRAGCDEPEGAGWTVSTDSTVTRAHQYAAGARRVPAADDPTGDTVE